MIIIQINNSGSAFDDGPRHEIARILRELADNIEHNAERTKILDVNGNTCGSVKWEES